MLGERTGRPGSIEFNYGLDLGLTTICVCKAEGGHSSIGSKTRTINSLTVDAPAARGKDDVGDTCGPAPEKGRKGSSVLVTYGKAGPCVLTIGETATDNAPAFEENTPLDACGSKGLPMRSNLVCHGTLRGVSGVVEPRRYIVC